MGQCIGCELVEELLSGQLNEGMNLTRHDEVRWLCLTASTIGHTDGGQRELGNIYFGRKD